MKQRDRFVNDYIKMRTCNFTGREWVFYEIERWLSDPKASQFFIITGEPGIGKSAIAARLVQFSDGDVAHPPGCSHLGKDFLSAVHFCYASYDDWILPERFARSLSSQLAMRYPEFAKALASDLNIKVDLHVGESLGTVIGVQIVNYHAESPEAVFDDLVRQPLKALCKEKVSFAGLLVILVDGLDEALSYSGPVSILRLLAACNNLPPQVKLLLTSRPREEVLRPFRPLEPLILDAHSKENEDDLLFYLRRRFEESESLRGMVWDGSRAEKVIDSLSSRSRGNFLVASKIAESMERGKLEIDDPEALETLPADLKDLYAWFLDRLIKGDRSSWRDIYRPVLGMLAAAFEPADVSTLSLWTGFGSQSVRDALHDLEEFLDPTLDGTYVFS